MNANLLTVEQFENYCLENNIKYANTNLEKFISDYELTFDNIEEFNISLLLSEYRDIESYTFIFEEDYRTRNFDFSEDIKFIAFYENKNTSIKSCFLNFKDKYLVSSTDKYVFENVFDFHKQELSEKTIKEIVDEMNHLSVFDWKSYNSQESVEDGCYVKLVVVYNDNKSFEVTCTGIFSEFGLDNYNDFINLMF